MVKSVQEKNGIGNQILIELLKKINFSSLTNCSLLLRILTIEIFCNLLPDEGKKNKPSDVETERETILI